MHPQRNDSSYLFDWMERLVRSAGPDLFRLLERVEARLRMGDPLVPSGTGETERHGPGSDRHDVLLTSRRPRSHRGPSGESAPSGPGPRPRPFSGPPGTTTATARSGPSPPGPGSAVPS